MLMYIFRDMVVDDKARAYPKMREFARLGSESALLILRWGEHCANGCMECLHKKDVTDRDLLSVALAGVESRIWLPHSMVAQYLQ
jgi:hypothetical protein